MAQTRAKIDENEFNRMGLGKLQPVKKIGGKSEIMTKRAALGELGNNRAVLRPVKDENVLKSNIIKNINVTAKPRVDTHWNKNTARTILTRSNSNSVKNIDSNTIGSNAAAKSKLGGLSGAQKASTVTIKTVNIENKIQHVKLVSKSKPEKKDENLAIKREDSNLSRRSLSKLKAALTRDKREKAVTVAIPVPVQMVDKPIVNKIPEKVISKQPNKTETVVSHSANLLKEVENIDTNDTNNLVLVSEYVNDIYAYLYHLENTFPIHSDFLNKQKEITGKMRSVLIDWINEVHNQFHLIPETFHMTVAIVDRYLQVCKTTTRANFQLVGVTALFIASKYEELYPPAIGDFVYITDGACNKAQIFAMEMKIMKALDFNLSRPLPIQFLRRFSKAGKAEDRHHTLSKYFLEIVTPQHTMASYRPSEIAAAALCLSLQLLNKAKKKAPEDLWNLTLEFYSSYNAEHLKPIVKNMAEVVQNAQNAKLTAIYTKYKSSKFEQVALLPELYGSAIQKIIDN